MDHLIRPKVVGFLVRPKVVRVLTATLFSFFVGAVALAGQIAAAAAPATSTDAVGPLGVQSGIYKFAAAIDPDVLPGTPTEIWARVYWPTQLKDPKGNKRPLILFLHGNHGTCGIGNAPRNDSSCEYTNEGTCPSGFVVTPNHEGYKYAAEHLASWGYVVASINANRGITCGGGNGDDWGLVIARGRLVLKHLEHWQKWSTQGGVPTELGPADMFKGIVDIGQVGLMGHSRGGEGVRAALNLFRDSGSIWPAKIPGLDIRAIFEIGAVDGQSDRVFDAPSVAWNQLLPLCDGDVSDLQGRNPFERMSAKYFKQKETESRPSSKSLQMVWGANHNFFNTEWQTSDAWNCFGEPTHKPLFSEKQTESAQQKAIAQQSMAGFFRANVGAEADQSLAQIFDPAFDLPVAMKNEGSVDRDFIPSLGVDKHKLIDDFTEPTGKNSNGPANTFAGVTVAHNLFSEPATARIVWQQPGDDRYFQTNFAEPGHSWDLSRFEYLDLRIGRALSDPETELKSPVDLSIFLVGRDEKLSGPIELNRYAQLLGPPNDNVTLMQTVRVPLKDFASDLSQVRGVRFTFNKTEKAEVRLAQVRLGLRASESIAAHQPSGIGSVVSAIGKWFGNMLPSSSVEKVRSGHLRLSKNLSAKILDMGWSGLRESEQKPRIVAQAIWLPSRLNSVSRQLNGAPAMELMVRTSGGFPVMNELPVLKIGNELFPVSRFSNDGKTHTLVFIVPKASYDELSSTEVARVQYGTVNPQRVWELPEFRK